MKIRKSLYLLLVIPVVSCAVINLEPLQVSSYPDQRNQIISTADALWVEFGDDVEQTAAETAITISSPTGNPAYNTSWRGRRISLVPINPWIPGYRYTLKINGNFILPDKRTWAINRIIPFYANKPDSPPELIDHIPENEAIIPQSESIILTFSKAMDTARFVNAIVITPSNTVEYNWNQAFTEVAINPKEEWSAHERYAIKLPATLTDTVGMSLVEERTLHFRTYTDITAPILANYSPWSIASDSALTGLTLNDMDNSTGIYLEFDNSMKWTTWSANWDITPSIKLETIFISHASIALVPQEPWIPEQEYAITIETELTDIAGNPLDSPVELTFICAIPAQKVERISHSSGDPDDTLPLSSANTAVPITLGIIPVNYHEFTLHLKESITIEELTDFISTIQLKAVFPVSITNPSLSLTTLSSGTSIFMRWENFDSPAPSGSSADHYYRLSQTANSQKTANSIGSYLLEDWHIDYVVKANP